MMIRALALALLTAACAGLKPVPAGPIDTTSPFHRDQYESAVLTALTREVHMPQAAISAQPALARVGPKSTVTCVVKLAINRDGSLAEDPEIALTSGDMILDRECVRAAKAAQFPPIVGNVAVPLVLAQSIDFVI